MSWPHSPIGSPVATTRTTLDPLALPRAMRHAFPHSALVEPVTLCAFAPYQAPKSFKSGSMHDIAMETDALYVGDMARDLLELFPAEYHAMVSPGRGHFRGNPSCSFSYGKVSTPAALASSLPVVPARRRRDQPLKPPAKRRRRDRKRTDKQKEVENIKRKIKQTHRSDRRSDCLTRERRVRAHVREWIHSYARSLGMRTDASIMRLLPVALREIMARSDAAILAYRGFSGQVTLNKELNELPSWW